MKVYCTVNCGLHPSGAQFFLTVFAAQYIFSVCACVTVFSVCVLVCVCL